MKYTGKLKINPSDRIEKSAVSIGFECLDRKLFNADKCYDPLAESGVKYARVQTGWALCETEKSVYDFAWLDDIVDNLLRRGIKPWFNVGFGNPLYMKDAPNPTAVGCVPLYYGGETLAAWKSFVRALTAHYSSRIEHYEIWNEPDGTHFWHPAKPDGEKYAELVSLTGAEIRAVKPDAKIGACTASSSEGYLTKFAKKLKPGEIDFYCLHQYSVFPELGWNERVATVRKIFAKYGHTPKIWMGEGGYPSWAYDGHWMHFRDGNNCSEHQQAVYQLRRYFQDVSLGLERSSFFQMADMWERPYQKASEVLQKPAAQGILNGRTYTKKESYHTISRLATLLSGDVEPLDATMRYSFGSDRPETLSLQRFSLVRNGSPMYVYYLPTDIQDERGMLDEKLWLCAETFEDVRPIANPVLIDPYTGDVFELDEAKSGDPEVNIGITVSGLPLAEYPLIICDRSQFETV